MSLVLTEAQLQALRAASALQSEIDALQERQDVIVEPIARVVAQRIADAGAGDSERALLYALLDLFPGGFYRTELRAQIIRKYGS